MPEYRLRQLALVTDDLEAITAQLGEVFGLRVGFRDPSVAPFGLTNAVFPVGGDFLEVVQPVQADASAARYRDRRGGDAGYMVILQTAEALQHRRRLEQMGVRRIAILDKDAHVTTQFHPKDFAGILASIDHMETADWRAPESDWAPAGADWRRAGSTESLSFASVTLQHPDPAAMASRWAELLDVAPPQGDPPVLPLLGAEIRFAPDRNESGAAMVGIDIRMRDAPAAFGRAKALGLPIEADTISLCGVAMRPVQA